MEGETSGTGTCVVAAVLVLIVAAVDAPTASARSGGRSSSSLRLLKAHEALLITIINRPQGLEGGRGGQEGQGRGWGRSSNRCSQMCLAYGIQYTDIFAKANLDWIFSHLPRD